MRARTDAELSGDLRPGHQRRRADEREEGREEAQALVDEAELVVVSAGMWTALREERYL
jgi:hypothetical protein